MSGDDTRIQTRSMSRQNSLQSGVEHITKRVGRVSTSEGGDGPSTLSPQRKHKLSISETPSQKKLRHHSGTESQYVTTRDFTRAVFGLLLLTHAPIASKKSRSPKQRKRRRKIHRSPIACTFSEAGQSNEITAPSGPANEGVYAGVPPLEFPDDIEADGAPASHEADQPGQQGTSVIDQVEVEKAARKLRNIGDSINEEVKNRIFNLAVDIVKKKAYDKYRETLDQLTDHKYTQGFDSSDRYGAALVFLLTETLVSKATEAAANVITLQSTLDTAEEYVLDKFPSWQSELL